MLRQQVPRRRYWQAFSPIRTPPFRRIALRSRRLLFSLTTWRVTSVGAFPGPRVRPVLRAEQLDARQAAFRKESSL